LLVAKFSRDIFSRSSQTNMCVCTAHYCTVCTAHHSKRLRAKQRTHDRRTRSWGLESLEITRVVGTAYRVVDLSVGPSVRMMFLSKPLKQLLKNAVV